MVHGGDTIELCLWQSPGDHARRPDSLCAGSVQGAMPRITSHCLALLALVALALNLAVVGPLPVASVAAGPRSTAEQAFAVAFFTSGRSDAFNVRVDQEAKQPQMRRLTVAPRSPKVADVRISNLASLATGPFQPLPPPPLPGQGPSMRGTLVAQTERLDLYVGIKTFSEPQISSIAPRLEQMLRLNEERFGTLLDKRISLAFYRPALAPDADTRGVAYTEEGRAEIFYRPYENLDRASIIAAHEIAHHLQAQRYGAAGQKRADLLLLEGQATWITGQLWLNRYGVGSWRERARQIEAAGVPLRLLRITSYGSDNAYELWASFFDFLIERYGMERLDALYLSSTSREPGSADYQGVLGEPLDVLADEWRAWVRG